jgi:hypothetical protein
MSCRPGGHPHRRRRVAARQTPTPCRMSCDPACRRRGQHCAEARQTPTPAGTSCRSDGHLHRLQPAAARTSGHPGGRPDRRQPAAARQILTPGRMSCDPGRRRGQHRAEARQTPTPAGTSCRSDGHLHRLRPAAARTSGRLAGHPHRGRRGAARQTRTPCRMSCGPACRRRGHAAARQRLSVDRNSGCPAGHRQHLAAARQRRTLGCMSCRPAGRPGRQPRAAARQTGALPHPSCGPAGAHHGRRLAVTCRSRTLAGTVGCPAPGPGLGSQRPGSPCLWPTPAGTACDPDLQRHGQHWAAHRQIARRVQSAHRTTGLGHGEHLAASPRSRARRYQGRPGGAWRLAEPRHRSGSAAMNRRRPDCEARVNSGRQRPGHCAPQPPRAGRVPRQRRPADPRVPRRDPARAGQSSLPDWVHRRQTAQPGAGRRCRGRGRPERRHPPARPAGWHRACRRRPAGSRRWTPGLSRHPSRHRPPRKGARRRRASGRLRGLPMRRARSRSLTSFHDERAFKSSCLPAQPEAR